MNNEEILFTWTEPTGINKDTPVTLLSKDGVPYALHSQTGTHHDEAIEIARQLLSWRGLFIGEPVMLGPSGLYYEVSSGPQKVAVAAPTMEPFGQHFVGIVDSYPLLSKTLVAEAEDEVIVDPHRNSLLLQVGKRSPIESLPAEYAYVLFTKLRNALFGSNPDAGFGSKE